MPLSEQGRPPLLSNCDNLCYDLQNASCIPCQLSVFRSESLLQHQPLGPRNGSLVHFGWPLTALFKAYQGTLCQTSWWACMSCADGPRAPRYCPCPSSQPTSQGKTYCHHWALSLQSLSLPFQTGVFEPIIVGLYWMWLLSVILSIDFDLKSKKYYCVIVTHSISISWCTKVNKNIIRILSLRSLLVPQPMLASPAWPRVAYASVSGCSGPVDLFSLIFLSWYEWTYGTLSLLWCETCGEFARLRSNSWDRVNISSRGLILVLHMCWPSLATRFLLIRLLKCNVVARLGWLVLRGSMIGLFCRALRHCDDGLFSILHGNVDTGWYVLK